MIVPDQAPDSRSVALHYDELDLAYRRIWGDHVHHGYWRTGTETPEQAAAQLVTEVEQRLGVEAGDRICDIGCGYGATAANILTRHDVSIIGLTLSAAQHAIAQERSPRFTCLVRDWLDNGLETGSFDRAYAIESSEHMTDKPRFFTEARRILRPGGRLVVCAWLEGGGGICLGGAAFAVTDMQGGQVAQHGKPERLSDIGLGRWISPDGLSGHQPGRAPYLVDLPWPPGEERLERPGHSSACAWPRHDEP